MLKFYRFSFFLIGVTLSNNIWADCTWPAVASVQSVLAGKTVCASGAQEQHRSDDKLWDYKSGPTSLNDPSDIVGTWTADDDSVTYTYPSATGTAIYNFTLHHNVTDPANNNYTFCGATDVDAIIISDFSGC